MTGERLDTYIVLTGKMHFMCLKANSSDFRRGNIKPFTCVIPFPKQEASRYLVLKGQLCKGCACVKSVKCKLSAVKCGLAALAHKRFIWHAASLGRRNQIYVPLWRIIEIFEHANARHFIALLSGFRALQYVQHRRGVGTYSSVHTIRCLARSKSRMRKIEVAR